ncbi:hypothetical protein R9C00_16600 [Flammeovirgaceae bacterium SG7u.111]|nr:hypothetical protein [Flammeovirgaceae bacterium SG7u.132]WPO33323.1 hypothetical protein R9C00_16600 [Flammeovirgaceae bacterium SG7u.111]
MAIPRDLIERLEEEYTTLPDPTDEILQHLQELGYINRALGDALLNSQIDEGKQAFKEDFLSSGLLSRKEISDSLRLDEETFLLQTSRQATDIDEGFTFKQMPELGTTNLITRIIHYRLELFGLWDGNAFPISSPFSINALLMLRRLEEYTDLSELDCINQLADIEGFTYRLLEERPPEDFILTFRGKKLEGDEFKKLERRRAFGRQLVDEFGEKNEYIKKLKKTVLKDNEDKIDYHFLRKESRNEFKKFVLRLIQVHQWQEGFYDGLLDSNMGDATVSSVLEAINLHNESTDADIKPHRALTYLDDGFYMFNGLFFLKQYMVENEGHNPEKLWEELGNQVAEASEEDREQYNENLSKIKKELVSGSDKPTVKKGFFKRVYCGVKKVLQKAMAMIKKLFKFVLTKLKQLTSFLTRIFKIFYENLRFGIKAFLDGLKFIIGRKMVVTATEKDFIISTFSLDGDCMNLANQSAAKLVKDHRFKTGYFFATMFFSLKVVQGVLQLVLRAVNMLSWPLLLIKIVQVVKMIVEESKELRLSYEAQPVP